MALRSAAAFGAVLLCASAAHGADYSKMAPVDQYMMAPAEETALARSAAVSGVSDDAGIMLLGPHGFETSEKSKNGFVCIVERAWDKAYGDAEFWNPKMRGPVCLNPVAVRTVLPVLEERARWAMSGMPMDDMKARAAKSKIANSQPGAGAMPYMLSKQQYLSDKGDPKWYPHVMFFGPHGDPMAWGANVDHSPVLADPTSSPFTLYFIPVRRWSDGTLADYPAPAPAATATPASADSSGHHH